MKALTIQLKKVNISWGQNVGQMSEGNLCFWKYDHLPHVLIFTTSFLNILTICVHMSLIIYSVQCVWVCRLEASMLQGILIYNKQTPE